LTFSQEKGLLRIVAVGEDIQTNGFGMEVQSAFKKIEEVVSTNYGEPKTFNYVLSGSIWNESQDWMMGLLKKERTLWAAWDLKSVRPNHIIAIALGANALSTEKAYLDLTYEFEGFHEFIEAQKAKARTIF
jgi:hypothetical protein